MSLNGSVVWDFGIGIAQSDGSHSEEGSPKELRFLLTDAEF